jgi:hypothetical protein
MKIKGVVLILFLGVFFGALGAKAERFDEFLQSLQNRLPMNTVFMQWVLKNSNTRLAHPSLLEKWGVINLDAAATYNGLLNTVVLKEDYTIKAKNENGKNRTRIKTVKELKKQEPNVWSVKTATIFHELSHAEYDWLPKSKDPTDKELLRFFRTEFDQYLKSKHPQFNVLERKIARSELFAYFRDEFLTKLVYVIDDIFLENGFYKTTRSCRNPKFLTAGFKANPQVNPYKFVTFRSDEDFTKMALPAIFVRGKDAVIDAADPITPKLKKVLWAQLVRHFAPATTKFQVINWINSKPQLLEYIKPCRQQWVSDLQRM